MAAILELLGTSWVGGLLGLIGVVGVLVLPFTIYLSLKGLRRKRIRHVFEHLVIIDDGKHRNFEGLSVFYAGEPVTRLIRSRLFIWNSGDDTIRNSDIVKADPFRVAVLDGTILEARVVKQSRKVIAAEAERHYSHEALITFDFIDPQDGFVVDLLHTSAERRPILNGTIVGVPEIPKRRRTSFDAAMTKAAREMLRRGGIRFLMQIYSGMFASFGIAAILFASIQISRSRIPTSDFYALAGLGILCLCLSFIALRLGRPGYPSSIEISTDGEHISGQADGAAEPGGRKP